MKNKLVKAEPVSMKQVRIEGGFWEERLRINRETTIAIEYEQCKRTGRIDAWKLQWKPGEPNKPHVFWDSDVAKWIEAVAYSLITNPDSDMEKTVDDVIEQIAQAQQSDGYLNSYFSCVAPEKRWTNLRDLHELYCAGHLIEAAVAYYDATGKDQLLQIICRYTDYIYTVFGRKTKQLRGYPGHEEIELALVKLYHTTNEKKYLELAEYFIDERGKVPDYFKIEEGKRNIDSEDDKGGMAANFYTADVNKNYFQGHLPVREQFTAEGHSVRACYLYSGMADVAIETNDQELFGACEKIWNNIIEKRMYIHGGIGSANIGECFTFDYDLPNEVAYAETCAAISLVFFAGRMQKFDVDGIYSDVIERALYNCILAGVSLDGKEFFYHNVLASYPEANSFRKQYPASRQKWFDCACCPPNLARFLASLGNYIYSQNDDEIFTHLYISGKADLNINGNTVSLEQKTDYPWDENIEILLNTEKTVAFTLALRIPEWCEGAVIKINDQIFDIEHNIKKGYVYINRTWSDGDLVKLCLPMVPMFIESHPSLRENAGRVGIQRGPVLYCLEEADNGKDLNDIKILKDSDLRVEYGNGLFENIPIISADAERSSMKSWNSRLYRINKEVSFEAVNITAVPYFMWANRGEGEMIVWIRNCR